MLHVRVLTKTNSFTTLALIDSGATTTFIPTDVAEILGIEVDPTKAKSAVGAGGQFQTIQAPVTIQLLKGGHPFEEFRDWNVLVPTNREAIPYVVLGRDSIFMKFDITFRERMQRTVLRASKIKLKKSRYEQRY